MLEEEQIMPFKDAPTAATYMRRYRQQRPLLRKTTISKEMPIPDKLDLLDQWGQTETVVRVALQRPGVRADRLMDLVIDLNPRMAELFQICENYETAEVQLALAELEARRRAATPRREDSRGPRRRAEVEHVGTCEHCRQEAMLRRWAGRAWLCESCFNEGSKE